ncbi:19213_t:CDS:1, partial [Rhizophagus irregularis]
PFRLQYPYEDEQLPRLQYCPGVHILKRRQQSQSTRQAEIINLEEEQ